MELPVTAGASWVQNCMLMLTTWISRGHVSYQGLLGEPRSEATMLDAAASQLRQPYLLAYVPTGEVCHQAKRFTRVPVVLTAVSSSPLVSLLQGTLGYRAPEVQSHQRMFKSSGKLLQPAVC